MSQRYTFNSQVNRDAIGVFGNFLEGVTAAEQTVAENTTARMAGVGQWIWPAVIGAGALAALFLYRKKGK